VIHNLGASTQILTRRVLASIDWRTGRLLRRRFLRLWGHPTISDMMLEGGGTVHVDADAFARTMCGGADIAAYREEFEKLTAELERRRGGDNYPRLYDIEHGTGWALYAHVRSQKPQLILETGVANGVSSYFLLNALRKNGSGTLHSIDVRDDVGQILNEDEREAWDLHVLGLRSPSRSLKNAFANLPRLDLFIHDSDHTYRWMRREFELAVQQMAPSGWLTSDDADASYAFAEFCARRDLKPSYLFDGRKIFAAAQVP